MALTYLAIICKSRKQNMAQWYGGGGGGGADLEERKKGFELSDSV